MQSGTDAEPASDEVANDAMQLMTVANYNGLCRVISALARNGALSPGQLNDIHDSMTAPLDDPDWRDYDFISGAKNTLETVLARAMKEANEHWDQEIDPSP